MTAHTVMQQHQEQQQISIAKKETAAANAATRVVRQQAAFDKKVAASARILAQVDMTPAQRAADNKAFKKSQSAVTSSSNK